MQETPYPQGLTVSHHIAHDMKAGRFPSRSSVEVFLAELERECPGHVASEHDPKVCGRCFVHIDSLRVD
jgi:hypothetical protein